MADIEMFKGITNEKSALQSVLDFVELNPGSTMEIEGDPYTGKEYTVFVMKQGQEIAKFNFKKMGEFPQKSNSN